MESLQLIDFAIDRTKDTYYFNKYPYKLRVYCNGIEYARKCHTEYDFELRIQKLSTYKTYNHISDLNNSRETILGLISIRSDNKKNLNLKFMVQTGTLDIYSTDLISLSDIYSKVLAYNCPIEKTATIKRPNYSNDTVYLKDSNYQHRCYLTTKIWTDKEKRDFYKYTRENDIKLCPSLKTMLLWKHPYSVRTYTWSSMFIDIKDDTQITYLSLKFSNLIRKVCKIEKR